MRKIFAVVIFAFTSIFSTAQNAVNVSQTVIPVEIYVGDIAEIRYNFKIENDIFANADNSIFEKEIDIEKIPFKKLEEKLAIKKARFIRSEKEYIFILQIVPWKPGVVEFPSFDLLSVLDLNGFNGNKNASCAISLEPVEIKSIVEKTSRNEIQPPEPPFIIPGTSYIIFIFVVVVIILLTLLFRIILKFGDFKRWAVHFKIHYEYRRNSFLALKKIRRLMNAPSISDIEFCKRLQNITRSYLEFRFNYPFASVSAIGMEKAFDEICFGEIPAVIASRVEDLTSMFIRTDYIRYAHDSIDSQLEPKAEHQAKLATNERKTLCEIVVKSIRTFESDGKTEQLEELDAV